MTDVLVIKQVINEVLDERDAISRVDHGAHHQFVEDLIERERRKREFRDALKKQVYGWAIISFLSGVGVAVYKLVVHATGWGES